MRARLVAIVVALLRAGDVAAQTTSCSFDTAAHTVMQTVNLALSADVPSGKRTAMRDEYLLAAQAIQPYLQLSQQLSLPLWARTVASDSAKPNDIIVTATAVEEGYRPPPLPPPTQRPPEGFSLRGTLRFRLTDVGALIDSNVAADTPSPDLNAMLVGAVKRAAAAQAFSPPSREVLSDLGTIRLRVTAPPPPDSLERSLSVLRLAIPTVVLDSPPLIDSMPRLMYPEQMRRGNVWGHVVMRMLVLPDGSIAPSSLELLQTNQQIFAQVAMRAVERAQIRPARIGACAVAAIIVVRVDFRTFHSP